MVLDTDFRKEYELQQLIYFIQTYQSVNENNKRSRYIFSPIHG
jgi:hypothetical protein